MTIPFFVLSTRGLETIVQNEVRQLSSVILTQQAYRRIHGQIADKHLHLLSHLRTADDAFLEIIQWQDIRHTRDMLADFTERSTNLSLRDSIYHLRTMRHVPTNLSFSVTASFVGKRNYNYHEIKSAISSGIQQQYSEWQYVEDDTDADINIRIFIEHQQALIGMRLAETPLHRRAYKQNSLSGSLKAPIAAAMLQLADVQSGQTILDPFCGSGTILIEAAQMKYHPIGGDSNHEALSISQANAKNASANLSLNHWDARTLPLPTHSVQAIVSNLPWGRQITVDDTLRNLYQQSYGEMKRVLKPNGIIVLLTTLPDLTPENPTRSFEISLHGQKPRISIYKI